MRQRQNDCPDTNACFKKKVTHQNGEKLERIQTTTSGKKGVGPLLCATQSNELEMVFSKGVKGVR